MYDTIKLGLIAVSLLALTAPTLAQSGAKADRMQSQRVISDNGGLVTAPVAMQRRAPYQTEPAYGWMAAPGFDRASSPNSVGF